MTIDEAIIKHIQKADSYHKAMPNYGEAADHRQLAEWLTELKELREENKEAKRLLKLAVEDFREINSDILTCKYCKWHSAETDECAYCPDDVPCEEICGWKHADEALKLIES